jgi:Fe-S-cluster-containing dehydrogenase component/DMSO reductase anchor subunit
MKKNGFLLDLNKCVGCMACVAGCVIENGTKPGMNWRVVNGYNKLKYPDLPVFHLTLACNHCEQAPCLHNCPALAYSRDEKTGAVIHHAERCIGCKYCTWVCPYDAPKFNPDTRVVEKCNFCTDRISHGGKPACAVACPVGALDFGPVESGMEVVVSGFVNRGIKPAIHLVPLRPEHTQPVIWNDEESPLQPDSLNEKFPGPVSKIRLENEWTLVPFTLTVSVLVGWLASVVTHGTPVSSEIFLGLGIMAIFLSTLHLGKKIRAWRSILNLQNSWLSREIFSYSLFLGLSAIYLFSKEPAFGYAGLIAGIASLVSIDMVYKITERKEKCAIHSSMVWLTGMMTWSVLSGNALVLTCAITLKFGLYFLRKIQFFRLNIRTNNFVSFLRLCCLLFPAFYFFSGFQVNSLPLLFVLLFGEVIDRLEFYNEIDVVTPERELFATHLQIKEHSELIN